MATDTLPPPANADTQVPLDTIPISPAQDGAGAHGQNGEQTDNSNENSTTRPSDDEQITIFHDKDNFNVKHPLMNEWTLWFTKPPSGKVYCTLQAVRKRFY